MDMPLDLDDFPVAVRLKIEVALNAMAQDANTIASIADLTGLPVSTVTRLIALLASAGMLNHWDDA